ncbi:alpha-2,8-sialyltransferase 8B-like [Diadema antillarum]|uniref:alpha-2,8-sialyltransferase 8B-like n=1 Tax=Diadema antillarum TaxID=105358 RepID=UPI003A8BFA63
MATFKYVKLCSGLLLWLCLVIILFLGASTTKTVGKDFKQAAKNRFNADRHGIVESVQVQTTAAIQTASKPNEFNLARKNLTTNMTREKIIQIFLPGIRPSKMKITKYRHITGLARNKQTRSLPLVDSCALVGNSGILSNSSCGDVIDGADLVLRMNLAPAGREYARDVGSKTNLTTINGEQGRAMYACAKVEYTHTPIDNLPDDCRRLFRLMQRLNNTVIWYAKGYMEIGHIKKGLDFFEKYHGLTTFFAYSPVSPFGATAKWMKVRAATTGAALYLAATTFCRKLTLYGFYPRYVDPKNRPLQYRYYDDAYMNYSTSHHSFNKEFEVLNSLENDGYLKIINDCAGRWDEHDYRSQLVL